MGSLVDQSLQEIESTLEKNLNQQGYELVELYIQNKSQLMRITIGHKSKDISHEDCVKFHRYINELVPDGWSIEIWSPGINRELKTAREFKVFQGSKIELTYKNDEKKEKKIQGNIKSKDDEYLYIDEIKIPSKQIKKVKLLEREVQEEKENVTTLFVEDLA